MIKRSIVLISTLFIVNANALDINSAVNLALKNNNELKQKYYEYDEAKENIELNKSGFKPKLDLSYAYTDRSKARDESLKRDSSASAVLSYNLFNGFSDYNLVKSAKYSAKASNLTLFAFKEDIVYNTKTAYIEFLNKRKNKDTYEVAYKLFKKQYEDSKNRFEQGLIAKNDLLDIQVKMLDAKQNLTRAISDLKIARYELSNILGGIDLQKQTIEELDDNIAIEKDSYKVEFLDNRSEIKALKMNIKSIDSKVDSTKGDFLPSIDASLSYNKYGDDSMPKDLEPDDQKVAQVQLKWNLYDGGIKYSTIDINRLKMRQVKEQLQKTKLDIKLQYQKAKSDLEVALLNYDSAKLALVQAKENYKIVNDKYSEGIVKPTDLTDANYLLTNAKQKYFQAYYDKFLAVAKLDRVFEQSLK
ncbi:RND family efflux system, outer membrane channel protein, TolC family [Malaciobacter marinus]|jgi:outer membrane protein TolC|uniref:RND family efflux system, outer membrane channel protein, TolC family n=1 Tax=Malaciobacter marinus TaxID=505249 RepID=A0A1T5C7K2_9BACT|nr:TolC family protein [Malaciobacter marinus]AXX86559.1 RND family efflux system, outer membrane channel protein, TolC family [Malaciobacter marinus]PHO12507.1 TolC family protein [Malaciobacter marinus]PHO16401.1 TolC family protein [Malaciobacter marinus]SKB55100.1 Outer membrane protein TolC [Malaciobacter marinus]